VASLHLNREFVKDLKKEEYYKDAFLTWEITKTG
jgi:hypothetical protein